MTTQSPPSTDANPGNPVCQHGVSLSLDDKPHCFECEHIAATYGLPPSARIMDYPNTLAFTAMLKANEAITGEPAPASVLVRDTVSPQPADAPDVCMCPRCVSRRERGAADRLKAATALGDRIAAATASAALPHAGSSRGLDSLMNALRTTQTEDVRLSGGQRMLERVVVQLRSELSVSNADRDAFAEENMELMQSLANQANTIEALEESEQVATLTVAELQKKLDAANEATAAQKANYTQMLKLYNDATGGGTIADIIRERNGLAHSVEELRKDLTIVRAERDTLRAKDAEIMAVVTRFG